MLGLLTRPSVKFIALFRLFTADVFAYQAASLIWVVADVVDAFVLPLVWSTIGGVGGMDVPTTIAYYISAMVASQFVTSHLLWDMSWDVREGALTSYLVRPFPHFWANVARNLAWRVGKVVMFAPLAGLMLLAYGVPWGVKFNFGWSFWTALVLGHVLSFLMAYCLATVALWTTEFVSVFNLYYLPETLLSGRVLPLGAFPDWLARLTEATPFRYTVGFPVDVLLGQVGDDALMKGFAGQLFWCLAFALLGPWLFRRGLRRYTGVGM